MRSLLLLLPLALAAQNYDIVMSGGRVSAHRLPIPGEEPWGALRALNWKTGETRWEFRVHTPPWCGDPSGFDRGAETTHGGLMLSKSDVQ